MSENFTANQTTNVGRLFYSISVPVLLAYTTIAFLVNVGVFLTVPWIKSQLNPTLRLTISLTLTDVWTSAMVAFSLVYNSYLYNVHYVSTNACVAVTIEVLRLGGFFSCILHLLALAVNHYLSTAHPFLSRKLITPQTTTIVIVFMWFIPTACFFIGFSSVPLQGYRTPNGTCQDIGFAVTFEFRMIILALICILLMIITILYIAVIFILHRMKRKFDRTRKFSIHSQQQQQYKRKRKTFITTLLIWLTFFLGWFPSSLVFVLMCQSCPFSALEKKKYPIIVFLFGFFSIFFILTKTLMNPIIYAIRIPEIKSVLQRWGIPCRNKGKQSRNNTTAEFETRNKFHTTLGETSTLLQNNNI